MMEEEEQGGCVQHLWQLVDGRLRVYCSAPHDVLTLYHSAKRQLLCSSRHVCAHAPACNWHTPAAVRAARRARCGWRP